MACLSIYLDNIMFDKDALVKIFQDVFSSIFEFLVPIFVRCQFGCHFFWFFGKKWFKNRFNGSAFVIQKQEVKMGMQFRMILMLFSVVFMPKTIHPISTRKQKEQFIIKERVSLPYFKKRPKQPLIITNETRAIFKRRFKTNPRENSLIFSKSTILMTYSRINA